MLSHYFKEKNNYHNPHIPLTIENEFKIMTVDDYKVDESKNIEVDKSAVEKPLDVKKRLTQKK